MKAWKKGAIVGGVWGLLGTPIFYLFIYLRGWERSFPKIAEETLSILLKLPLILLKPLFEIVNLPSTPVLALAINLIGWTFIGGGIGYIIDKYKK